ncbi:MAG: hypothetical protein PWQ30_1267 [Euryarchaeota archaeon]|jgi:hypothetical protein|nr:hypothetical protein [Euryarchaeota archaeon]
MGEASPGEVGSGLRLSHGRVPRNEGVALGTSHQYEKRPQWSFTKSRVIDRKLDEAGRLCKMGHPPQGYGEIRYRFEGS